MEGAANKSNASRNRSKRSTVGMCEVIGDLIKSNLSILKVWKCNSGKTKTMESGPITSQLEREKVETVRDFIFLGSKITVDGDCSHEIKRGLLFGRKAMINLDSILKSRDITLPTKVRQSYGFSSSHECM